MTTDPPQPAPTPPRRQRTLKRWITLALLLAVAAWIAHFVYTRLTGEPTPRPEYWTQKIMAIDPPPPNAITEEEFGRIASRFQSLKKIVFPKSQYSIDPSSDHSLNLGWDDRPETIQALTEVFEDPQFGILRLELFDALQKGWSIDPQLQFFNYIPTAHHPWTEHLAIHGRWALHENKSADVMVENLKMSLLLARQLQRPRTCQHLGHAFWMYWWVGHEMMALKNVSYAPIDTLVLVQQVVEITGPRMPIEELTKGERLWDEDRLENVYVREEGWFSPKAFVERPLFLRGNIKTSAWWNLASPLFHDLDTARAAHEAYYDQLARKAVTLAAARKVSKLPYHDPESILPNPVLNGNERFKHVSGEANAYANQLRCRCTLDAGLTMLALHEYHRRHEVYPESLEDLLPEFLPRLPIDDAHESRQPLRYRRTEDEQDYMLYSVGVNGVDDGGRHIEGKVPLFEDIQPDVVFTAFDWRLSLR